MVQVKGVCVFFLALAALLPCMHGQDFAALPVLKPSFSDDLLAEKDGIKTDCIRDIFLDHKGRLYLQTCGQTLVKKIGQIQYDGYRFDPVEKRDKKRYADYDFMELKGVSTSNLLYGLYEHRQTKENGIIFLDPDSREVVSLYPVYEGNQGEVVDMVQQSDSTFLIASLEDTATIHLQSLCGGSFEKIISFENIRLSNNHNPRAASLLADRPTETWYLRGSLPLMRVDKASQSARKYFLPDFEDQTYFDFLSDRRLLASPACLAVAPDESVYLYIGRTFHRLNREKDQFVSMRQEFPAGYTPVGLFEDHQKNICFVWEDETGQIKAILQDTTGKRYNYSDFFQGYSRENLINVVSSNFFSELTVCGVGSLIHMYVQEPTAIQTVMDGYFVSSIMEMPEGDFLVNTVLSGWFTLSKDFQQTRVFSGTMGCDPNPFLVNPSMVQQIIADKAGNYWWIRDEILYQYHPQKGTCQSYDVSKLRKLEPALFAILGEGKFAFADWAHELYFYDINSGKEFFPGGTVPGRLNDNIYDLLVDRNGILWIPTSDGLWKVDWKHQQGNRIGIESGFEDNFFQSIHEDASGNLWLGTAFHGLQIYDPKSGTVIKTINDKQGLAHNSIVGIIPDKEGQLWVSTEEGITFFSQEGEIISSIYKNDGLNDNFFARFDPFLSRDGHLFFGTQKGLNILSPTAIKARLKQEQIQRKIYLTELKYFDARSEEEVQTQASPDLPFEVHLPADKRNLTVSFALSAYMNSSQNQYAYRLAGIEKDWNYLGAQRSLTLSNLPAGRYTLQIKGGDFRNNWSMNTLEIPIYAREYFYKTIWFYGLLALPFVLFALLWIYRIRRENKILEEEVARRTKKIQVQNTQLAESLSTLQTTQQQLILQEKMASLGQVTMGIAHEIKNPLNFVNNYAQVSVELADELEEEFERIQGSIAEKEREVIVEIIHDLRENAEVIRKNGHRADSIVSSMRNHANDNRGQRTEVAINALVKEQTKLAYYGYKSQEPYTPIHFEYNLAPDLPLILINPQEIGRVIINLITNACYALNEKSQQATPNYSPSIHIQSRKIGQSIEISIRDNGPGIPVENMDKIFQPFFTTKPTGQGNTGLGLSISYDIVVNGHQGKLSVESEENTFTEFVVLLPVKTK